MSLVRLFVALAVLLVGSALALADTGERRVALVIGNGAYSDVAKLPNPASDAASIGQALRDVGFTKVTVVTDLTHQGLFNALRQFSNDSATADWSVLYYAGHGIEVDGKNYLVPVDAHLATDRDVEFEGVSMQTVYAAVGGARELRLVILDACRDNPFLAKMTRSAGTRSITRGLARSEPEGDLYVVYSAKSGQVALDGEGGRNPFVSALLKNIETPGIEINLLFRKVRADVDKATNGQQEPDFEGSLPGEELYFKAPPAVVAPPSQVAIPASTPQARNRLLAVEPDAPAVAPPAPVQPPNPAPIAPPKPQPQVTATLEQPPPAAPRPPAPDPRVTAFAVQTELDRVGCDAGQPNGEWTIKSRMALLMFSQKVNVSLNVDVPDENALKMLRQQRGLICPPPQVAPPPQAAPPSQPAPNRASLEPEPVKPRPAPRRPPPYVVQEAAPPRTYERPVVRPPTPRRSNGGGGGGSSGSCFMFNGERVCE